MKRDRAGFRRFYRNLDETALLEPLKAIADRHRATLFDVYADATTASAIGARLEIWFWLMTETHRSYTEVATLFDRERSSVAFGIKQLHAAADARGSGLAGDTVAVLAFVVGTEMGRPRVIRKRRMTNEEKQCQERFQRLGLPWPTPDAGQLHAMGLPTHMKFVAITELVVEQHTQTVHTMPPHYPSNVVVVATTIDDETGEEIASETREMTPEEWTRALAAYDKARKEWSETNGIRIIKSGPQIITATFHLERVLDRSATARARWTGRDWRFDDWRLV